MKFRKSVILIIILLTILCVFEFQIVAGNNDSLPSYGYIGDGAAEGWKYTRHYSGIRISIYWAPDINSFVSGQGVIPIGKTVDVTKTGPEYRIKSFTNRTIYKYMLNDNMDGGMPYSALSTDYDEYNFIGLGEIFNSYGQDIVSLMPDVWTGTKEQWDIWFEGGRDGEYKDYRNIPEIFKLCGAEITVDDFKNGIYVERNYRSEPGVYKIFLSRLLILL